MATASLVLAIGGWVVPLENRDVSFYYTPLSALIMVACPVLALVFGHIAIYRINRGRADGRGRAIAGLVIAYLQAALIVAGIVSAAIAS